MIILLEFGIIVALVFITTIGLFGISIRHIIAMMKDTIRDLPETMYCLYKYPSKKIKSLFIENSQKMINENHFALVICLKTSFFGDYDESIYSDGLDLIRNYCIENKFKFSLYVCHNIQEFKSVIYNPNASILWIFGHGWMGGINLGKEKLEYCKLKDAPKKYFIGQFHCNSFPGCSLDNFILKEGGKACVRKGYHITSQFRTDIKTTLIESDLFFKQILEVN